LYNVVSVAVKPEEVNVTTPITTPKYN